MIPFFWHLCLWWYPALTAALRPPATAWARLEVWVYRTDKAARTRRLAIPRFDIATLPGITLLLPVLLRPACEQKWIITLTISNKKKIVKKVKFWYLYNYLISSIAFNNYRWIQSFTPGRRLYPAVTINGYWRLIMTSFLGKKEVKVCYTTLFKRLYIMV